ncbi:metabotropic glutamate receptor 3-like [Leptodactylus fuscus]|uniref:metabotropic glutamate receptor 3-like n=1 Tax=Leptodactylus fuscus TaxID=238119 RepID=UPI003F4EDCF2
MAALFWTLLSLVVLCSNGDHVSGEQSQKRQLEIVGFIHTEKCYIYLEYDDSKLDFHEIAQLVEAIRFAIEEINENSTILPGVTLVFSPRIVCEYSNIKEELENMNKSSTIAAVIEAGKEYTLDEVCHLLQDAKIPVIGCSMINLKLPKDPFFVSTASSVQHLSKAIIDVLTYFGWTYVSVLASSDDTLPSVMDEFQKQASRHKICFASSTIFCYLKNSIQIFKNLQSYPKAQVLVLFVTTWHLEHLLNEAHELNVSFIWVVSTPWKVPVNILKKYNQSVGPIITIQMRSYPLQRLNEHFQAKMKADSYSLNNPSFRSLFSNVFFGGTAIMNLDHEEQFPPSLKIMFAVNAAYAIAYALQDMYNATCPNVSSDCLVKNRETFMTVLTKTRFTAPFIPSDVQYTVGFDRDDNGLAHYDIFTIQENNGSLHFQHIGSWANKLTLNTSQILWEDNMVPESHCGKPCGEHEMQIIDQGNPCCWDCVKCDQDEVLINNLTCKKCDPGFQPNIDHNNCSELPLVYIQWGDGLAIGSVCISCLGILSTIFVVGVLVWNNNTPIVKASGREFCYILLSGVLLLYIMTFFFIAQPSVVICSLRRLGLATSFSICYSALLTKTNRITRIFTSVKKGIAQPRCINLVSQLSICLALVTCQLVGLSIWLIVDPAEVTESISPDNKYRILMCKSGDMTILFSLLYDVLLILLCTAYAFKTRKYPENFNEAKCIGFTMYTTCIIWLAFLPISYVTFNYPKVQITTLCASVSLCAFVILAGLFMPKLYIIFYHPEKNIKSRQCYKGVRHVDSSYGNEDGNKLSNKAEGNTATASKNKQSVTVKNSKHLKDNNSKGLNFVPSQQFNMFDTLLDVNKFVRALIVDRHFHNNGISESITDSLPETIPNEYDSLTFKEQVCLANLKSLETISTENRYLSRKKVNIRNPDYYPLSARVPVLDHFQTAVESDLIKLHHTSADKRSHNLTKQEKDSLKFLQQRDDIVIRMADKGGKVVIMNSTDYNSSVLTILQDTNTCKKLSSDPTHIFSNKLFHLLQEGVSLGIFTEKEFDYLYVREPIIPIFHGLPKIHKDTLPPPLRPIISGIGSLNERICMWVDTILQPLVTRVPGYIKDTKDLLRIFDRFSWEENYKWLSYDISLYSRIPHHIAVEALLYHLYTYSHYTEEFCEFIIEVANYLLKHNFFMFNGEHYLQLCGVPMGARFHLPLQI